MSPKIKLGKWVKKITYSFNGEFDDLFEYECPVTGYKVKFRMIRFFLLTQDDYKPLVDMLSKPLHPRFWSYTKENYVTIVDERGKLVALWDYKNGMLEMQFIPYHVSHRYSSLLEDGCGLSQAIKIAFLILAEVNLQFGISLPFSSSSFGIVANDKTLE